MRSLSPGLVHLVIAAAVAAQFAGVWAVRSFEADGVTMDGPIVSKWSRIIISGNNFDHVFENMVAWREEKGTFSIIGAGRDHFQVDVWVLEKSVTDLGRPPARNIVRKELWRLTNANTFQRSFPNDPSGDRPKTFAAKKGDGVILMTFERREK